MGMLDSLEWKWITIYFYLTVLVLPFAPNKRIRYYGCYLYYYVALCTSFILMIPIFLCRPRNPKNLLISAPVADTLISRIVGIRWVHKNLDVFEKAETGVIVANHQTAYDALGMTSFWRNIGLCTVTAKKSLQYFFPVGTVFWLSGFMFLDRSNRKTAVESLQKLYHTIVEKKIKLWVFPEGTRNTNGQFFPFKKGGFRTAIDCQVPIIPVVFSPYYFMDFEKKTMDRGEVTISVLEPIPTKGMTVDDVDTLIKTTHDRMFAEFQQLKRIYQIKT